ncbi:MAG: Xaa-Pro peptidase family protein, partial [Patescibacteria group bacterium]
MRPELITDPKSLEYLIGFTGSHGFMVLGKKNLFFTDFRYRGIAKELERNKTRLPFKFMELDEKTIEHIQKNLGKKELAFEANHLTVAALNSWKKKLKGTRLVPGKNSVEEMRLFKDKNEIALLKKSQKINEETLYRTKKLFKKGVTELELAWKIKTIGHDLGAEDISFEPIVAFGPYSAIPHHHNTNTKLKSGDTLLVDMGMKYKGYCSDMTRTFFFGKPSAEQRKIYELVLAAQEAGIKKIKAGIAAKKVDEAA